MNQKQQFINFPWGEKVNFMITFYREMQKKTENKEYIAIFQTKIDEVKGYKESEENAQMLIDLYDRIISAQQKTRTSEIKEEQEKMQQAQERIKKLESQEFQDNPDEYLADQLINM